METANTDEKPEIKMRRFDNIGKLNKWYQEQTFLVSIISIQENYNSTHHAYTVFYFTK